VCNFIITTVYKALKIVMVFLSKNLLFKGLQAYKTRGFLMILRAAGGGT